MNKTIYVYFDHLSDTPIFLGTLQAQFIRSKELFSFEYDADFLRTNKQIIFDPDLQFFGGPQYTKKENFGMFTDSAPDRWGRTLMRRREAIRAKNSDDKPHTLNESDYLLGVYDETRMGALRFKMEKDGKFQNFDSSMAAPPWTRLRELEEACRNLERNTDGMEDAKWLSMLYAPGSSLGGARPKASVSDVDGSLWIAKFPSHNDNSNVAKWEYLTMQMATDAGLNVPPIRLENFSRYGSTFLVKRFDRRGKQRIHFSSAMTMLGKNDGADSANGNSYLDIARFITQYGAKPDHDLLELWSRIVFSIAVSNTDDHLRNHGFLLTDGGWTLSPLYDVNPNPQGHGLSLNISENDNSLDLQLTKEVAPYFRVSQSDAEKIIQKITSITIQWRKYAELLDISRTEQSLMQNAFIQK